MTTCSRARAFPAGRRRRSGQDHHVGPPDSRVELRGLAERILIVCPANLAFQWQRELKEKFDTKFLVMKGQDIRDQFGVNQWTERTRVITSLGLAKREDVLPGVRQVHWDLVIVDEAHRMSASDESHNRQTVKSSKRDSPLDGSPGTQVHSPHIEGILG